MPCVNHPDTDVQSWCQNCGKPLCKECVRTSASGQILCESCLATGGAPASDPAYWQAFVAPPGGPNPSAAAVLGLIPGVGAMYNGQLFKGLIHVIIFAVLVSITDHYGIFGIFIGAWVLYQSFEAYHTAKARRDGQPLPDPFGLNELGNWLNLGSSNRGPIHPGQSAAPPTGTAPSNAQGSAPGQPPYQAQPQSTPYSGDWGSGYSAGFPPPPQPPYTEPYAGQYQDPYAGYPPPPGSYPPGAIPPVPPVPGGPPFGRRQQPVWAFILIGLGIMFLLHTIGVFNHFFRYTGPILLIGFGVWLIVRRTGYFQGGSK
jgi:hypothetical protein